MTMAPEILRKCAVALLVIALPGIACHGYYAYEAAADASVVWRVAIVLAYPALLLMLTWVVVRLCSAARDKRG